MTPSIDSPIIVPRACTLSAADGQAQALEWVDIRGLATSVVAIDSGVRVTFPVSVSSAVEDLAKREAACCTFLTITTATGVDEITLEVITADRDALPELSALAGVEIP